MNEGLLVAMSMEIELKRWDGKSSDDIEAIFTCYNGEDTFVSDLIEFSQNLSLQSGATWLLKRYLESKHKLDPGDIATLYQSLPKLQSWEAKLHILQCIPFMPIEKADKKAVEMFLRNHLTDTNKFVRAWTYNGFYEIAVQYPEYKKETKQFFEMAMRDESPSVKARIRNIIKKGFN